MTVPGGTDKNSDSEPLGWELPDWELPDSAAAAAAVVGAFAPACYAPSWVPWLRWVGAACVVVILVITLHLVPGLAVLPLL